MTWPARSGDWRIVVMNADGTRSVTANLTVGARFPRLLMMGVAALGLGDLGRASGSAELRLVLRRT
jgi:hypothetical protein